MKIKLFCFVLFSLVLFKITAQSLNDYRSNGNGDWDDSSNWEVYNGSAWVGATNYPGEVAGTNDVTILGNDVVNLEIDVPNSFNSLTVGDNTGGIDRLEIRENSSLLLNTLTITGTGQIEWVRSQRRTLSLPAGTVVIVENGGEFVSDNPCNANKRLAIGGSVYATCNGGGGNGIDYTFDDINNAGGTLQVVPTSNTPLCFGTTLNLFANAIGQKPAPATYTFSWTATSPAGYTFSSSLENPTITTALATGTYTYVVTITDDDNNNYTFTNDTEVIIDGPNPPINGGNQIVCNNGTLPTLTASVNIGQTIDWYDASTLGNLLLTGNTNYTPIMGGDYYAEARNTSTGCVSPTRTKITLTTKSCSVITNRRITYRVNTIYTIPKGVFTNDIVINNFDDGQNGSGNSYQLQITNTDSSNLNYQIWVQNVPYSIIPGLTLVNHTVQIKDNGDSTYNYLYSSTSSLAPNASRAITGSGGAPSPLGIGIDCGCVSFFKL